MEKGRMKWVPSAVIIEMKKIKTEHNLKGKNADSQAFQIMMQNSRVAEESATIRMAMMRQLGVQNGRRRH